MKSKQSMLWGCLGLGMLVMSTVPVYADSVSVNFENYTLGDINQDGWSMAGSYDAAVVSNTYGYAAFGSKSLRMSNYYTSGSFDQVFAKPLVDAVGEVDATNGSFDPGTLQRYFVMQFDIASADPSAQQENLAVSVSPDRGDGSRMSFLRFEDGVSGIDVYFDDWQVTPADFVETEIATGLDRTVPHTIKLTMEVKDGPSNDVVNVYIDGALVHSGTSWEDFYRYDPEQSFEPSPRIVKSVTFMARDNHPAATDVGKGFLFDNISLTSSAPPLANGSFEESIYAPTVNYAYIPTDSSDLTSWLTTQKGVEWFDPNLYHWGDAEDGKYAVDLAPTTLTGGGIKQSFYTQMGKFYKLTFYGTTLAASGRDGTGQVDVLIDDSLNQSFSLSNNTAVVDWKPYDVYFTAASPTTTVEFQNNQDPNYHFAMIDAVSVAPPPPSDLVVTSITASPSPVAVGQDVTLTATVSNVGADAVGAFQIDLYKDLGGTPPTVGTPSDKTCPVSGLAAGASTTCDVTVTYSEVATKIAWAKVDTTNTVKETNENNNTGHVGVAVMQPDLIVTGLTVDPSGTLVIDQPVSFSITVTNASGVDAINPFRIDLYKNQPTAPGPTQNGGAHCTVNGGLAAHASYTCTKTMTYSGAGSRNVWAQVDTGQSVDESKEDNNLAGPTTVTVVSTVTLTLNKAGIGSGTVTGGGNYSYQTVAVNADPAIGSVFAGWSGTNATECATGFVEMTADKTCTATFDVDGPPSDLVVSSITASPSPAAVGEPVTVTATITNSGGSTASGFNVDLAKPAVGDSGQHTCAGNTLAAGDTMTCVATFSYNGTGTKHIWAQADTQNSVGETNETNNTKSVGLSVAKPDLYLSKVTAINPTTNKAQWSGTAPLTLTLTATVTNASGVDVYTPFNIDLYQNNPTAPAVGDPGDVTPCTVPSLAPHATVTCSATVTYSTPDTYIIWGQADTGNAVDETNEGNNVKQGSLSITVKP